jgi:L-ascorbate 6-phosphate lactonase
VSVVELEWYAQSSFLLRAGGATVLIDPFLSPHPDRLYPPPFAPEEAPEVDAVLVTHEHLDHLDADALPKLRADAVLVPSELGERVEQLGISNVVGVGATERVELAGLAVHGVPACHGETPDDAYRTGPFRGYVVEADGVRVYHAGDTIPFEGLVERLRDIGVELALVPINGRSAEREAQGLVGNLDEREAAELVAAIGADAAVPMHWDLFAANTGDPAKFTAAATTTVIRPQRFRPFAYAAPRNRRSGGARS